MGPIGVSPLQQLGVTLKIEDAAQRYQSALFLNGARPPSAITASEEFLGLAREERQEIMAQLREDVQTIYSGPDNGGKPALLPPGLDWKPVGHSAVEAALIDQRRITREEIAGVYMIPPPMLGILDKATYSNIETQREMTYTDCLGPPLILIEQTINAQVVMGLLAEQDVYCEFDFSGVLRGNKLEEIEALREQIGSALLTPNEGRDLINMPRSPNPGMDEFYLPFNNLAPVGTTPQPIQPPAPRTSPSRQQQAKKIHVATRRGAYDYDPMEAAAR
jgi:HK97 family phage portal protein